MPSAQLPKYEQVKRSLIAEIDMGRWSVGGAIPSESQLLQRFNVSRPTLVRSLQDLVREGYLFRRQGKGTFVADRAARNGDAIATPTRSVPVFAARHEAAPIRNPGEVLLRLLRGAQSVLGPAHVDLALRYASVGGMDEETESYLDKTEPTIALVIEPSFSPRLRVELQRRGWTVWSVNEPWAEGNAVYIDQQRAGYLATRYLIEKRGRKRVALLNGPPDTYWGFGARLRGYHAALEEAGIEPDQKLIRTGWHVIDTEAGRSMMRDLLEARVDFDGVVGASDMKAIGALAAAQEAGRRVPDDVVVIGIDDILAARATPPISSVSLPFEDVGRRAAEEALRSAASHDTHSPAEIQLKPTLVER
ncbi:MAG: GntR family transcriptional regulator, arabinose operon transcriptional repressor [Phycisphaerales bacterium]|jgi:DNA-binding LacI/PurR family transcriptional regulator|nr:GntR family transcriptional regulator, arabinose operon transcriptional repressor [Phycisphaerales bacterium]